MYEFLSHTHVNDDYKMKANCKEHNKDSILLKQHLCHLRNNPSLTGTQCKFEKERANK